MNSQAPHSATLGADLRALRKARGLTLSEIAAQLGRSVGWLSQVERDMSDPSISDLRQIAESLGVPMSMLFAHLAHLVEGLFIVGAHLASVKCHRAPAFRLAVS